MDAPFVDTPLALLEKVCFLVAPVMEGDLLTPRHPA